MRIANPLPQKRMQIKKDINLVTKVTGFQQGYLDPNVMQHRNKKKEKFLQTFLFAIWQQTVFV